MQKKKNLLEVKLKIISLEIQTGKTEDRENKHNFRWCLQEKILLIELRITLGSSEKGNIELKCLEVIL